MSRSKNWHHRLALQIAAQLPEDTDDQLEVLNCVHRIVGFLARRPRVADNSGQTVLRFPGKSKTPRRRASSSGNPSGLPK